ncbi:MAG: MFS transporter [Alphaproteobacteria bacterium]|nr:MFS transporter [Alphaproteobacteria bacterium]
MQFISKYFLFFAANRRFLGFGFLMAFGSSFGQTFFISLFGAEIRGEFGLSHGDFGALFSVATVVSAFILVWLGRKVDVLDLRWFSLMSTLGLAGAALAIALVPNVLVLGLGVFALRLCGQGLMTHAAMTSMARYFQRGRGRAISLASLGFSLGEGLFPVITVGIVGALGWRGTWFAIAAVAALVVTPLVQVLLRGHGERHRSISAATPANGGPAERKRQWTRRQVLGDARFYVILPAILAPAFIVTGFFFHQVHLVAAKGWPLSWFATCFVAFAISKLVVTVVTGPLVDRFGARRLLPYVLTPVVGGLLVLSASDHMAAALVFMVMIGVTAGSSSVIGSALWAEVYGVTHLGSIRAMAYALTVFASALSPAFFGWLIDGGVSMEAIAFGSALYALFGSLLTSRLVLSRIPEKGVLGKTDEQR